MNTKKLTKKERSWVMYDVANSGFVILASTLIPIYFNAIADPDSRAFVAWGYATTVASLILAIIMPFLGSIADLKGNKKKFFVGTMGTGALFCAIMGITTNGGIFLTFYVIATIMLNASQVFYDAFLVDATDEDRYAEVSSQGYAWGYIGSCIPFVICLVLVLFGENFGVSQMLALKISFVITAIWWVAFSIPMIKNVKQEHYREHQPHILRNTCSELWATTKRIFSNKAMAMYLIAYFFYIDGVHTIISMATSYGTDLGIDTTHLVLALLVMQVVAWPASIVYGRLADKYGARKMLLVGIGGYFFITLFAAFFLRSATEFWILAICVGLFQGGLQAISRSEFGKMIPKERSNEYFGFFDIFGKYASVLGTFIVSLTTQLTGSSYLGVLGLSLFFIIGFVVLLKTPQTEKIE